jgi:DNA uptake protein ComE-like DNA-binding protein
MKRSTLASTMIAFGIAIPLTVFAAQTNGTQSGTQTGTTSTKATHHHSSSKSAPKVDINTASAEQLMALPGIDQTTADKIVSARPFKSTKQLYENKIVTKDEYKSLESKITVKAPKSTSSKSSTKHTTPPATENGETGGSSTTK